MRKFHCGKLAETLTATRLQVRAAVFEKKISPAFENLNPPDWVLSGVAGPTEQTTGGVQAVAARHCDALIRCSKAQ